jgi:hypothetical protein
MKINKGSQRLSKKWSLQLKGRHNKLVIDHDPKRGTRYFLQQGKEKRPSELSRLGAAIWFLSERVPMVLREEIGIM